MSRLLATCATLRLAPIAPGQLLHYHRGLEGHWCPRFVVAGLSGASCRVREKKDRELKDLHSTVAKMAQSQMSPIAKVARPPMSLLAQPAR